MQSSARLRYMTTLARGALVGTSGIVLAAALGPGASHGDAKPGDPARGRSVYFNRCVHCHTPLSFQGLTQDELSRYDDSIPADTKEVSWRGPSLSNLFGQTAATDPSFTYSSAMKAQKVIWNEDTLRRFLLNPAKVIPGNAMRFNGIKRDGEMEDLIAYLRDTPKDP